MKKLLNLVFLALFASFMVTACVLSPGPGGYGVEVAPALPVIVELNADPYYYQGGYHYYYRNDRWQYSRARNGPWTDLPRSHWPKETRHRGGGERGWENRHEHERR